MLEMFAILKSVIDLQISSCDNSSQSFVSADFSPWMSIVDSAKIQRLNFIYKHDLIPLQNDAAITSLLSWYSVVFSICKHNFDR